MYEEMRESDTMACSRYGTDFCHRTNGSIKNIVICSGELGALNWRLGLASRYPELQRTTSLQDDIIRSIVLVERMFVVVRVSRDAVIAD